MRKRTIRLNHELESLHICHLEELKLGDKIEIHGISQGLSEEDYELKNWDFIRNYTEN